VGALIVAALIVVNGVLVIAVVVLLREFKRQTHRASELDEATRKFMELASEEIAEADVDLEAELSPEEIARAEAELGDGPPAEPDADPADGKT
jgi:uncharacterized membrane protein